MFSNFRHFAISPVQTLGNKLKNVNSLFSSLAYSQIKTIAETELKDFSKPELKKNGFDKVFWDITLARYDYVNSNYASSLTRYIELISAFRENESILKENRGAELNVVGNLNDHISVKKYLQFICENFGNLKLTREESKKLGILDGKDPLHVGIVRSIDYLRSIAIEILESRIDEPGVRSKLIKLLILVDKRERAVEIQQDAVNQATLKFGKGSIEEARELSGLIEIFDDIEDVKRVAIQIIPILSESTDIHDKTLLKDTLRKLASRYFEDDGQTGIKLLVTARSLVPKDSVEYLEHTYALLSFISGIELLESRNETTVSLKLCDAVAKDFVRSKLDSKAAFFFDLISAYRFMLLLNWDGALVQLNQLCDLKMSDEHHNALFLKSICQYMKGDVENSLSNLKILQIDSPIAKEATGAIQYIKNKFLSTLSESKREELLVLAQEKHPELRDFETRTIKSMFDSKAINDSLDIGCVCYDLYIAEVNEKAFAKETKDEKAKLDAKYVPVKKNFSRSGPVQLSGVMHREAKNIQK